MPTEPPAYDAEIHRFELFDYSAGVGGQPSKAIQIVKVDSAGEPVGGYERVPDGKPIVVIGASGSGKSRLARKLLDVDGGTKETINALRSTQIPPEYQSSEAAKAASNARIAQAESTRNHNTLATDFDHTMQHLYADKADQAVRFLDSAKAAMVEGAASPHPPTAALDQVKELWELLFPRRTLGLSAWRVLVTNLINGTEQTYTGEYLSDGEKAALYLLARVVSSQENAVLLIDEPECHLPTELLVRLFDYLESARPDVRFIYATHDLGFADSRRKAIILLAAGSSLKLVSEIDPEIRAQVLGAAGLSFYAHRVAFCEGTLSGLDYRLYQAWFSTEDTVVRPVGSCDTVRRCVAGFASADVVANLQVIGVVDRDHLADDHLSHPTQTLHILDVHEVESLFGLAEVVKAVCEHKTRSWNEADYTAAVIKRLNERRDYVAVQRWRNRCRPQLQALANSVNEPADAANVADPAQWGFDPAAQMIEEQQNVTDTVASNDLLSALRLLPGKEVLTMAALHAGMDNAAYCELIIDNLSLQAETQLSTDLDAALSPRLPSRSAP